MDDGTPSVIEDMKVTTDRETPDQSGANCLKHLVGACLIEVLHSDGLHSPEHTVVGQIAVEAFLDAAIVTISRTDHNNSPFIGCKTNGICSSLYT